jgi:hypothetical protein
MMPANYESYLAYMSDSQNHGKCLADSICVAFRSVAALSPAHFCTVPGLRKVVLYGNNCQPYTVRAAASSPWNPDGSEAPQTISFQRGMTVEDHQLNDLELRDPGSPLRVECWRGRAVLFRHDLRRFQVLMSRNNSFAGWPPCGVGSTPEVGRAQCTTEHTPATGPGSFARVGVGGEARVRERDVCTLHEGGPRQVCHFFPKGTTEMNRRNLGSY